MSELDYDKKKTRKVVKEFCKILFPEIPYKWFKEDTGLENWVLYREDQFIVDRDLYGRKFLHYCGDKDVDTIELPFGVSSTYYMFSDNVTGVEVKITVSLGQRIVDTRNMFFNNYTVKNIDLAQLDLSHLQCADFMFASACSLQNLIFQENLLRFPISNGLFMGCNRLEKINNHSLFKIAVSEKRVVLS